MAPRRWPVFCGNVEGADLTQQESQSTTHIDLKVATGGMLRVLSIFRKVGSLLQNMCHFNNTPKEPDICFMCSMQNAPLAGALGTK